jgi:CDP-4-dehydro-6-deoxyglucose reductase
LTSVARPCWRLQCAAALPRLRLSQAPAARKGKVLRDSSTTASTRPILPDYEKKLGFALFCQAKPLSDLVIEARVINATGEIPIKKLPCRVQRIERPAADVAVLYLTLPASERLQFLAGQYLEIILRDGKRRAYSMANPPEDDAHLELHVRSMPGGSFTDYVFNRMKKKDILRFEGPLGTFFLREDSDKPIIFVASGTGSRRSRASCCTPSLPVWRQMVLYWGGRRPRDLHVHAVPAVAVPSTPISVSSR